jgi:Fe-S cluster assembly iron-binding protein IscA
MSGGRFVLTLTTDAAEVILGLVAEHPGTGLRILPRFIDGDQVRLGAELSGEPAPTDQIIEEQGVEVFVDEEAVPLVDGRILDAHVANDQVDFKLLR